MQLVLHSSEGRSHLPWWQGRRSSGFVAGGSHAVPVSLVCRGLLQVALQRKGQAPEEEEDPETR